MNDPDRKDDDAAPAWPRAVAVELIQDISRLSSPLEGFLRRHRHRVKTVLSDGQRTDVYAADFIDRASGRRNAVAVAAYAPAKSGDPLDAKILLRRQMRYAAYLITGEPLTTELIAGILEDDEPPEEAVIREMWEEAGINVENATIQRLGPPFFVLPGVLTEQILPMAVEVPADELERATLMAPVGDGSAFEEGAEQIVITIREAYERIERGVGKAPFIADAKTELILSRLVRALEKRPR